MVQEALGVENAVDGTWQGTSHQGGCLDESLLVDWMSVERLEAVPHFMEFRRDGTFTVGCFANYSMRGTCWMEGPMLFWEADRIDDAPGPATARTVRVMGVSKALRAIRTSSTSERSRATNLVAGFFVAAK